MMGPSAPRNPPLLAVASRARGAFAPLEYSVDSMNTRRQFIRISAGIAAAGAPLAAAAPLPTARLGKYDITRLIIGSNPFYGYSHTSRTLDEHMREWSTPDNVCAALQEAGRNGITTFQTNGNDRSLSDVEKYHAQGGKLKVITLIREKPEETVARVHPIAVSHHGEATARA